MRFDIDQDWVNSRPTRRLQSVVVSSIVNLLLLALAWYANVIVFWILLLCSVLYWGLDLFLHWRQQRVETDWDYYFVEVRDDGLLQSAPPTRRSKVLRLLTPWKSLVLKDIKRSSGKVVRIRLLHRDLPKGARTIDLCNFEKMDRLLSEIEAKIAGSTEK